MKKLENLATILKKKGFDVIVCQNSKDVISNIQVFLEAHLPITSVGFGNSVTLQQLGLAEVVENYTDTLYMHKPVGTRDDDKKALTADFYLCSANAVSLDGHIINIDGTGNRTAATCFGPEHLVYVIGKNKIVDTLDEALDRASNIAAVGIAKKYGRKTPCVKTGRCMNCNAPECVCAITTIHRRKPYGIDITIVLVDEELGI